MITRDVRVLNKAGIHTRPASLIVRTAAKFPDCDFFIIKDGYEINGKSIIGVMTLAAEHGSTLTIQLEGENEEEAADKIAGLFEDGFGEEIGELSD